MSANAPQAHAEPRGKSRIKVIHENFIQCWVLLIVKTAEWRINVAVLVCYCGEAVQKSFSAAFYHWDRFTMWSGGENILLDWLWDIKMRILILYLILTVIVLQTTVLENAVSAVRSDIWFDGQQSFGVNSNSWCGLLLRAIIMESPSWLKWGTLCLFSYNICCRWFCIVASQWAVCQHQIRWMKGFPRGTPPWSEVVMWSRFTSYWLHFD